MEETYSRTDLLGAMIAERGRWDTLLDEIDVRRMDEPGALGTWSVKLAIAHIIGWERWAAELACEVARGESSESSDFAGLDFDQINARFVAPYIEKQPSDVRAESDDVFRNLLGSVERLTPEQVAEQGHAFWSPDPTVGEIVAECSVKQYQEHMPEIRGWLDRGRD
jgi:Protein of unknown function (DUF1706)